jgi:hypothetical protein
MLQLWTTDNPPDELKHKPADVIKTAVTAGNQALQKGLTKEEALFSACFAAGVAERQLAKSRVKPTKTIPEHLQAVLDLRKAMQEPHTSPTAASSTSGNTNVALVYKNALEANPERSLVAAEFDKQGRLNLIFDTGEKIITNEQVLKEYIEQYVTVAPVPFFDYVQFNTASSYAPVAEGMLTWNQADGTLDLGMLGGDVTQQIGLEQFFRIKNQTGSTLQDGKVVMAVGAVGNSGRILASLAQASVAIPSIYTLGIVTHDIPDGTDGFVTQFGAVRGINTTGSLYGETWADGEILYLHPSIPGGLTKVLPTAPVPKIVVAMVLHAHQNGQLFVRPTFSEHMHDINDVLITSIQNNQVLAWDSASGTFQNKFITSANLQTQVRTVTENSAVVLTDSTIRAEPASDITITLPLASTCLGQSFYIKKTNTSQHSVTIQSTSTDVIDGESEVVIYQPYLSLKLQSYGQGYDIL